MRAHPQLISVEFVFIDHGFELEASSRLMGLIKAIADMLQSVSLILNPLALLSGGSGCGKGDLLEWEVEEEQKLEERGPKGKRQSAGFVYFGRYYLLIVVLSWNEEV